MPHNSLDLYLHHPRPVTFGLNDNHWPTKVAVARADMEETADIELEVADGDRWPNQQRTVDKLPPELR